MLIYSILSLPLSFFSLLAAHCYYAILSPFSTFLASLKTKSILFIPHREAAGMWGFLFLSYTLTQLLSATLAIYEWRSFNNTFFLSFYFCFGRRQGEYYHYYFILSPTALFLLQSFSLQYTSLVSQSLIPFIQDTFLYFYPLYFLQLFITHPFYRLKTILSKKVSNQFS